MIQFKCIYWPIITINLPLHWGRHAVCPVFWKQDLLTIIDLLHVSFILFSSYFFLFIWIIILYVIGLFNIMIRWKFVKINGVHHFIYNQSFASFHPSYWFGSGKIPNFGHCKILQAEKKGVVGKLKFKS